MALSTLGWDDSRWEPLFRNLAPDGCRPGRVVAEHEGRYRLGTERGEMWAEIAGKLHPSIRRGDLPAIGDFVAARLPDGDGPAIIRAVLPRKTAFVRKAAGSRFDEQVVAANVDTVFVVSSLDRDFDLRRLERYLTLAWDGGVEPILVLSKADLCDDVAAYLDHVRTVAIAARAHAVSARHEDGLRALAPYLTAGRTVAVMGSPGVGKSTLVNRLLGRDAQATRDLRPSDGRGRHATSHRALFALPGGALMIDTPGMRELALGGADRGLEAAFADLEALAACCRHRDCRHEAEHGCAVRAAVERGELPEERLASHRRLARELRSFEA